MAKQTVNNGGGKQGQRKKKKSTQKSAARVGDATTRVYRNIALDKAAKDWAKLLADPCKAPLVNSCFPGADGATLIRTEYEFTLGVQNVGDTAGWLYWIPGVAGMVYYNTAGANGSGTTSPGTVLYPSAGNAALSSAADSYRCVSACLQVMYTGTELNRSGTIGLGYAPGAAANNFIPAVNGGRGLTTSADQVRTTQMYVDRTPADIMEIVWKPNQADAEFTPNLSSAEATSQLASVMAGKSGISVTAVGLQAGVGVRVRMVAVYEFFYTAGSGIIGSTGNAVASKNTVNDVLYYLDKAGSWFIKRSAEYGPLLGQLAGMLV